MSDQQGEKQTIRLYFFFHYYLFIYLFYHTCMLVGSNPRELHNNPTAIQHSNSALSV